MLYLKADDEGTDEDTLEYELKIKCRIAKNASKEDKNSYIDSKGLSIYRINLLK